jgi:mannose-6-phosphate isomerase-like protein (cupin superfamily)
VPEQVEPRPDVLSATRPWGSWHVLDVGDGYKVKRIEIEPGHRLSYQTHARRSEHWLVVAGTASCVVDGRTVVVRPGEHLDVAESAPHRIANDGSTRLVIVEVQLGEYTEEDDIVRLEDDYSRCEE